MSATKRRVHDRLRGRSPISIAIASNGRAVLALGLVSGIISILMLTGSLFMIQIYDRVLASRSLPTLIAFRHRRHRLCAARRAGRDPCRVLTLIGERIDARVGPDPVYGGGGLALAIGAVGP